MTRREFLISLNIVRPESFVVVDSVVYRSVGYCLSFPVELVAEERCDSDDDESTNYDACDGLTWQACRGRGRNSSANWGSNAFWLLGRSTDKSQLTASWLAICVYLITGTAYDAHTNTVSANVTLAYVCKRACCANRCGTTNTGSGAIADHTHFSCALVICGASSAIIKANALICRDVAWARYANTIAWPLTCLTIQW